MRACKKKAKQLGVSVLTAATLMASLGTVPALAATNEQTIGIKGTVSAISTLDITVPVQPLEFTINNDGVFSSDAKQIENHTAVPVYAYMTEVYGASGNYPALVNANAYGDWSGLDHDATIARMALQMNGNDLSSIYKTDSATKSDTGNYIALGSIDKDTGVLGMQLTGNSGKAWNNATDIVFTYKANMLFTTIEGNFGNGGGAGSTGGANQYKNNLTVNISNDYDTYATTAEAAGYHTLKYSNNPTENTQFNLFKSNGNTANNETITVKYLGWKDNANGTAELYVKYDTTCDVLSYQFGAGSSSYNTMNNKQEQTAGTDNELKYTVAKADLGTLITDGGLNISINPKEGSTGFSLFLNANVIEAIKNGVTGA